VETPAPALPEGSPLPETPAENLLVAALAGSLAAEVLAEILPPAASKPAGRMEWRRQGTPGSRHPE